MMSRTISCAWNRNKWNNNASKQRNNNALTAKNWFKAQGAQERNTLLMKNPCDRVRIGLFDCRGSADSFEAAAKF